MSSSDRLLGADWTQRYERLRAGALGAGGGTVRGLALFLGQGMAGWMSAWERLVAPARPRPRTAPGPVAEPGLPSDLAGRVAEVLAGMILHRCRGAAS